MPTLAKLHLKSQGCLWEALNMYRQLPPTPWAVKDKLKLRQFNHMLNDMHFHFFSNQLNKIFFLIKNTSDFLLQSTGETTLRGGVSVALVCWTVCTKMFWVNLDLNFAFLMAEREEQRKCTLINHTLCDKV